MTKTRLRCSTAFYTVYHRSEETHSPKLTLVMIACQLVEPAVKFPYLWNNGFIFKTGFYTIGIFSSILYKLDIYELIGLEESPLCKFCVH